MNPQRAISAFLSILLIFSLCGCPQKIELDDLPGDISGIVTDTETNQPIPQVALKIDPTNDSTYTADDGTYLMNNIKEGDYKIRASKSG